MLCPFFLTDRRVVNYQLAGPEITTRSAEPNAKVEPGLTEFDRI